MRKVIAAYSLVLLANALVAQTAPRTTLSPSGRNAAPSGRNASPSSSQERQAAQQRSPQSGQRTTARPSPENQPVMAPRLPQVAPPLYYGQSNSRPNTTARGTASTAKKGKAQETVPIQWLTLEQAVEKSKTEKRKIYVDVYTDWCSWCKHMDSTTFVDPSVARYLNEHFYPVKFNAEQQQEIVFKDKTYQFKKSTGSRGLHELTAEWLGNRLSYPTSIFLDEQLNLIQPVPNYQEPAKMETILHYFGTNSHLRTPWESYERNFVPSKEK